jgi:hypothetical protein
MELDRSKVTYVTSHAWNCNPKETDTIFSAPDTPHFVT